MAFSAESPANPVSNIPKSRTGDLVDLSILVSRMGVEGRGRATSARLNAISDMRAPLQRANVFLSRQNPASSPYRVYEYGGNCGGGRTLGLNVSADPIEDRRCVAS